jgi:hypothetical protein
VTEALAPSSPLRDRKWPHRPSFALRMTTINRCEFIEGAALVAGSVAVTGALAFAG